MTLLMAMTGKRKTTARPTATKAASPVVRPDTTCASDGPRPSPRRIWTMGIALRNWGRVPQIGDRLTRTIRRDEISLHNRVSRVEHPVRSSVIGPDEISTRQSTRQPFGKNAVIRGISRFGAAMLFAITLVALIPLAGAQQTYRAKSIGQRLKCVCGCNEVLTACNHVGCTYSHTMLKELDDRVARGDSDGVIIQSFIQEYGPEVLVDPPKRGFTSLVWIAPILLPILAFFLIWEMVRRWRHRAALAPAGGPPISPEMLDRARRESTRGSDE
jgi:cytochrome c-type biogenesis protein CcmH/NrfF